MGNEDTTAGTSRSGTRSVLAAALGVTTVLALIGACRAEAEQHASAGPEQEREGWEQVHGSVEQGGSYTAVAAPAADEVWVFGDDDTESVSPWIHLWDGREWTEEEAPADLTVIPNEADADDGRVWAVGSSFEEGTWAARHDGDSWSATEIELDLGMEPSALAAVGNHAWVLAETIYAETDAAYFDGREWVQRPAPTVARGLDASAPEEVFAVGGTGEGPVVERWDGSGWAAEELPGFDMPVDRADAYFNDVLARSEEDVWAVGAVTWQDDDEHHHHRALVAHYDGTGWSVEVGEDEGQYESVADDGDGGLYLVDGHWESVLEHRTAGGRSTRQPLTDDDHDIVVNAVAAVPGPAGAVAVGSAFDQGDPDEPTSHARIYGTGGWYD